MKLLLPSKYIYYTLGILILIGGVVVYNTQRGRIQEFTQEQIQRNNLISREAIEEPVLDGLKPQIININQKKQTLYLPDTFTVSILSEGLKSPQLVKSDDKGNLFVADNKTNSLYILPVSEPQKPQRVDTNLTGVYGLDWYKGSVYVATQNKVIRYTNIESDGSYKERSTLIDSIPTPKRGSANTIAIKNDRILIAIPANCENCKPKDSRRGSIVSYALDGSDEELFAQGLKSITDILPIDETLLVVDIGREGIGNNLPQVELNKVEKGKDYGWPYCYEVANIDPKYPEKSDFCKTKSESSIASLPHGNGVKGFDLIPSSFFKDFGGKYVFVYQGGQTKSIPKGYKVVIKDISSQNSAQNFITGWVSEDGTVWGQPTGVTFDINGAMIITDQLNGVIYKVAKK